jgi:hypothetical protein
LIKRADFIKLAILMVEVTSPPLILLATIYLLSGYQMLIPTVKILPEPRRIHTDSLLRLLTVMLAYFHTIGGSIFIIERRMKRGALKKAAEIFVFAAVTTLTLLFLMLEAAL